MTPRRLGIVGGTFDPIHIGHVDAARLAYERLRLTDVWLLPTHVPPHRPQPCVSPFDRFAMTALACAGHTWLSAVPLELLRAGHSYTADTLTRLHSAGSSPSQIFFITGADAFAEIETWKQYPAVLDMAVFCVVARTGFGLDQLRQRLPGLANRWVRVNELDGVGTLDERAHGRGEHPVALLHGDLPDVSATAIRQRLRGGHGITGLVPELVEEYIARQHLYGPVVSDRPQL